MIAVLSVPTTLPEISGRRAVELVGKCGDFLLEVLRAEIPVFDDGVRVFKSSDRCDVGVRQQVAVATI